MQDPLMKKLFFLENTLITSVHTIRSELHTEASRVDLLYEKVQSLSNSTVTVIDDQHQWNSNY